MLRVIYSDLQYMSDVHVHLCDYYCTVPCNYYFYKSHFYKGLEHSQILVCSPEDTEGQTILKKIKMIRNSHFALPCLLVCSLSLSFSVFLFMY